MGRVAGALNRMLTENEAALAARGASEARLRQFVADASHELRTPLASVRGYTELLRTGDAATLADRTLALRRIEAEAIRMSGLVEDLLLLARLDQGRPLCRDPVDLAALATDAVTDLRAADPTRPVALHAGPQVIVAGDADRLRQVLANLLTNARQHTPPSTPVQVSVHSLGPTAVLEVTDDGPGLTPSQAAQVFERFYRADPSRTRTSDGNLGAGLGLAIVAAITHGHGGHAAATSRPGTGANFRVELPAIPSPAASRQPASSSTPAEASQRTASAASLTASCQPVTSSGDDARDAQTGGWPPEPRCLLGSSAAGGGQSGLVPGDRGDATGEHPTGLQENSRRTGSAPVGSPRPVQVMVRPNSAKRWATVSLPGRSSARQQSSPPSSPRQNSTARTSTSTRRITAGSGPCCSRAAVC